MKYRAFKITLPNGNSSMWYEDIANLEIKNTSELKETIKGECPLGAKIEFAYTYKI